MNYTFLTFKLSVVFFLVIFFTGTTKLHAQIYPPVYLDYPTADFNNLNYYNNFNSQYDTTSAAVSYVAVAFNSCDGYVNATDPAGSVVNIPFPATFYLDSIFIVFGHENHSGLYDHFIAQIVTLDADTMPTSTVLWQWEDSSNVSLSQSGSWVGNINPEVFSIPVQQSFNQKFGIVFKYIDPSFADSFGIVSGCVNNGSGGTNQQSNFQTSYLEYPPYINTPTKNAFVGYGTPVGSQGWIEAQNWYISALIYPTSYIFDSAFYVYITPVSPNCSNNGSLTAHNYGGAAPFSFLWSDGQTTQLASGLGAGYYEVTVTDDSGLVANGNFTLYAPCNNVLEGTVFNDANGNCIYDFGDTLIQGIDVMATNGTQSYYGYTDWNGNYSLNIDTLGTFTVSAYPWGYGYGSCGTTCNGGTVVFNSLGDTSSGNNIGFTNSNEYDLALFPIWSGANPGFEMNYNIFPLDFSGTAYSGISTVTFHYDSNLVYSYSLPPLPVHDIINHTLTWNLSSVTNSSFNGTALSNAFMVPLSLPVTYVVESDIYITPITGDCDTANNHLHTSGIVTGSFDPNEKEVTPSGNITITDSILIYTIHFQNTGSDTTHFVIVADTLPSSLNPATVVTLASSSPFSEFSISGNGILKWVFNPMYLPDSATNEPASKGFVMFKIKVKPDLAVGTEINNTASIYFDYNQPVLTNSTSNKIVKDTVELTGPDDINIYPNPASDALNVQLFNGVSANKIEVVDVLGRVIYSDMVNAKYASINLHSFYTGVYFVKVQMGNGNTAVKKFVKE